MWSDPNRDNWFCHLRQYRNWLGVFLLLGGIGFFSAHLSVSAEPPASLQRLAIENRASTRGSTLLGLGNNANPVSGAFLWANRLTPREYPATIKKVMVGWAATFDNSGVKNGQPFTLLIWKDPEGDGLSPQQVPDATLPVQARIDSNGSALATYKLPPQARLTISKGSFVVGVLDNQVGVPFPALLAVPGKSQPPGSASYLSEDQGATFQALPEALQGTGVPPGSWVIRAQVSSNLER